jgi:hypothetical protein
MVAGAMRRLGQDLADSAYAHRPLPLKEHFGSIAKSSSSATIPFRRRIVGSPSAVPKRCGPAVSAAYEDVSLGDAETTGVAIPREPLHDNAHPLDAKKVE